jgi:hypothetical protein
VLGTSSPARKSSPIDLAFDRLGWVRIVEHRDGASYEVVGIARRRPLSCPVSAETAAALLSDGLRSVIHRCEDCEAVPC